ncbi:MAG: hypothetical protein NC206_07115 [Bacteroides sp.]|nr:hypothetical protein [Roseburia sp.]MCM1346842.1 hypothetical protein [Bacteroides sp.]MCM1420632.1 hypothetical protein [Bacteroides sp.]
MENFNKQQFLQVAKWDLTINSTFYRNIAIVTLAGILSITLFAFFIRWIVVAGTSSDYSEDYQDIFMQSSGYTTTEGIVICVSYFIFAMSLIFAGCINHPLRNKQGRISTLTLPATNLEKYLWHALLMTVGCGLFCGLCIIVTDLIYILFSFLVFPTGSVYSITLQFFHYLFGSPSVDINTGIIDEVMQAIESEGIINLSSFKMVSCATGILMTSIFAFGNAVKYKNNIILTVIFLTLLQFAFFILFSVGIILFGESIGEYLFNWANEHLTEEMLPTIINSILIGIGIISLGISALLWRQSYRLYCKAQVTSNTNKN